MKTSIRVVHFRLIVGRLMRASAESHRPIIRKIFFYTFALIAVGVFLTGCGNAITLQPTATRAASASPAPPSATLVPSATASILPSATPMHTARPTRTARPPTLTPTPSPTLIGESSGKIAFVSDRDGNKEIYVMNADGSGLTQLTQTGGSNPSWLPTVPNSPTPLPDCTSGWTRLTTGSLAQVSTTSATPNRVRAGPSRGNDIIGQLPPGAVVNVLEGPVCADGLVFWKVESDLIPGGAGWTAEGDGTEYYLVPYQP